MKVFLIKYFLVFVSFLLLVYLSHYVYYEPIFEELSLSDNFGNMKNWIAIPTYRTVCGLMFLNGAILFIMTFLLLVRLSLFEIGSD